MLRHIFANVCPTDSLKVTIYANISNKFNETQVLETQATSTRYKVSILRVIVKVIQL